MEERKENIYKGPRYNKEKAEEYYLQAIKYYQEENYKESNKYLIMAIECGYSRDVFKKYFNKNIPIFENKCLNDMLLATFGLLDDFNKLNKKTSRRI